MEVKTYEPTNHNIDLLSSRDDDIIMYTVKDIRRIFKCSPSQAYGLVNANGFPTIMVGGKKLVEKAALLKWLDKNCGKRVLL